MPLCERADQLVDTYVGVKMSNPEATAVLYRVAGTINQAKLSTGIYKRLESVVVRVLESASDASFSDPARVAFTLLSALAGLSRSSFGQIHSDSRLLQRFREESRLLVHAYLKASADVLSTGK
ncbi:hypothetical protein [Aestuariicella hydrocarbonica]|uniref:hypothetical protein n=1 Tax=Pseudomaricurvus hydrocarbonicus TaxID=1470433 RepID=UPI001AA06242